MRSVTALFLMLLFVGSARPDDLPKMKFNDVKEVAPGVFFRYSSISATDDKVVFGGCNNTWVVFEDYVVVIDANFPKEAGDVIEAVKKTTDKPIRYVFDTHHHGDHAYGNDVFAKAGASIVAQSNCARLLRIDGPKEFADAGKRATGRKDIAASKLKVPNLVFDDKLVLDDGTQRVEFHFFGHAHTAGDAAAYLPKYKILCTGDACVNGAYNFMGHSDSASWIRALERMQQLDVKMVCPGHGPIETNALLEKQKRYFVELRQIVQQGIKAKKDAETIAKEIDLPWYKEWTGVQPAPANVKHVYDEFTGGVAPWDFSEEFDLYEGPSPTKESTGWKKPKRILVASGLMPAKIAELKQVAPEVEFVPVRDIEEAIKEAGDADAALGFWSPELLKVGKNLRWVQVGHTALERVLTKDVIDSPLLLTSTRNVDGAATADRAFDLLLTLARKHGNHEWHGKTVLVVGMGAAGTQICKRANASGMRVMAIDEHPGEKPDFVFSLDNLDKLSELLPKADAVILVCPLTEKTKGLIGAKQLQAMKKTAYLINVSRSELLDGPALLTALADKTISAAGLGETNPKPLSESARAKVAGQIEEINAKATLEAEERRWRLIRENVRRFVAGEKMLGVVDKARGY